MDIKEEQIKVKVYYSLRGGSSTRLSTFQLPIKYDQNTNIISVPLKKCLWSICSSSPDMICHDHDLSVYSANFNESIKHFDEQKEKYIWEGHGLMSWVMEDQHANDIQIEGKLNHHQQTYIDVYIELQPTLKWCKNEFYNALQTQDFDGFKQLSISSSTSSNQICKCSIHSLNNNNQPSVNDENEFNRFLKRRKLTPPPTPSTNTTLLPSIQSNTSSQPLQSTNSSPPRLPPPASIISQISSPPLPLPDSSNNNTLFRPEPLLPSSSDYLRSSVNQTYHLSSPHFKNENDHRSAFSSVPNTYHHHSSFSSTSSSSSTFSPPLSSLTPPPLSNNNNSIDNINHTNNHYNHHTIEQNNHSYPSNNNNNNNDSLSSNNIPVVYTPSNKKKKRYNNNIPTDNHPNNNNNNNKSTQVTAIRTYYEVDKDQQGKYILPVEIDSWTVVDLGTVVYDRPAYHNQRYIYPVGYTVRKWYRSMVDAKSDTQYTCRILDNGREPKFEVTADDCLATYSGPTPTTVWTIIVRRAFAIRNQEYGHNPVGPDFFGLRKNTIAKMIQDLPNVDKCSQYVWQTFEPARFNKPGRNRRRLDTMITGSVLGGVNYSLTSGRLNTAVSHQQHQLQIQKRRLSSAMGITGTLETSPSISSSPPSSSNNNNNNNNNQDDNSNNNNRFSHSPSPPSSNNYHHHNSKKVIETI